MNQNDIFEFVQKLISSMERKIDLLSGNLLKYLLELIAEWFRKYASGGELPFSEMQKYGRYQKEMAQVGVEITNEYKELLEELQAMCETIYKEDYLRSAFLYELAAQIKMGFSIPTAKVIKKAIQNPIDKLTLPALMEAHRNEIVRRIDLEISQGLLAGEDYSKIAKRIEKAVGFSRSKAHNVAVTEGGRVAIQARLDSFEIASKNANMQKVWISTLDMRTRHAHRELDGQKADKDGYFHYHGIKAKGPHLWMVAAMDCNCRCDFVATVNGKLPDTRRARDYQDAEYQQKLADRMDELMADEGMTQKQAEKQAKKEISAPNVVIPWTTYTDWFENRFKQSGTDRQKLNYDEEYALTSYLSPEAYKVNEKLRRGLPLGEHESMVKNLDNVLKKLPKYKGTVFRDVYFSDDEKALKYYNLFVEDDDSIKSKISFNEYLSSSKRNDYNEKAQFQLIIQSTNARDLKGFSDQEEEVLFARNSQFKILSRRIENGRVIFEMEEL